MAFPGKNKSLSNSLSIALAGLLLFLTNALADPGDLYVTGVDFNQTADSIFKFTPNGAKSVYLVLGNDTIPEGLAFDTTGNLFVAIVANGTIQKITPAHTLTTFASGLSAPDGIAFDSAGNLFVGTSTGIVKITPSGAKSTFANDRGDALAFDHAGNLFASDGGLGNIYKFAPDGGKSTFASGLNDPAGIAFDSAGNLFVAENFSGTIFKFSSDGDKTVFASGLNGVRGLAFDNSGNLFVATGGSIRKFTPDGNSTLFGSLVGHFLTFEPTVEKLRNISARGLVQTGENVLIAGLVVGGNALANNGVIVRAIGPSLANFGIVNPLRDPILELHDATGALIASNDNWASTQRAQIVATGLAPTNPRESAIYATLAAGAYTAIVRGANNSTGIAVVEAYSLAR
jgi:sugar lactone lactonase YvrE